MPDIDWPSIRAQYEQGVSQRSLAVKYGVSQPAISQRAKKEGWVINPVIIPQSLISPDKPEESPDKETVLRMAHTLLSKMSEHTEGVVEVKDIKLLADALSQIHKIELTSTSDKPTESGLPADLLDYLSMADLDAISEHQKHIEAILDEARALKLEAEQGIKTMRKTG